MDTAFSKDEIEFRDEVRAFLDAEYTDEIKAGLHKHEGPEFKDALVKWQIKLKDKGWLLPNWPTEFGGTGWDSTQRYIYDVAFSEAGAPKAYPPNFDMVGPVIYAFGNEEQKERFLPPLLNCETWWCQGYSEPGAGSDLAALQTKAVRDGDDYIVNGTKVWTTYAQYADWMFCLVRTSSEGKKQAGISFLLIEMDTPGIEVREIKTIDGYHNLNEMIMTDVRVPVSNRIGEENKGWTYAKSLLNFERTTLARVTESKKYLAQIKDLASKEVAGGKPLIVNRSFSQKLAKVEMDLMSLEFTELRVLASTALGEAPGAESSILKLRGSEIRQKMQSLRMDLAGYYKGYLSGKLLPEDIGHDFAVDASRTYLHGRAASILGGSTEVQKNVIAKAVLGM